MALKFLVSNQTNPYWNIAVENYLVEHADGIVLYLWKNHRTVVIGQNQNPFTECDVDTLEADGGYLMRRKTGGGAVYHDDGNINFSFVVPKDQYDQQRQFSVIQRAVDSFGLHTELSGRNDILVDCNGDKRKFSGNAFSKGRKNDLHHGTILIRGNMDELQRYLKPKPAKLQKHGVSSVRSRVVNLSELNPEITAESLVPRLREAFESEYSEQSEYTEFSEIIKLPEVRVLYEQFASDEWRYERWRNFSAQRSGQFDWGGVELQLTIEDNIIKDLQIASDALDINAIDSARNYIVGASLSTPPAATGKPIIDDIISLIL